MALESFSDEIKGLIKELNLSEDQIKILRAGTSKFFDSETFSGLKAHGFDDESIKQLYEETNGLDTVLRHYQYELWNNFGIGKPSADYIREFNITDNKLQEKVPVEPSEEPRYINTYAFMGMGKSSCSKQILSEYKNRNITIVDVNKDRIHESCLKFHYYNAKYPDVATKIFENIKLTVRDLLTLYGLEQRISMHSEQSSPKPKFLQKAKEKGFSVKLHEISGPYELANSRAYRRFMGALLAPNERAHARYESEYFQRLKADEIVEHLNKSREYIDKIVTHNPFGQEIAFWRNGVDDTAPSINFIRTTDSKRAQLMAVAEVMILVDPLYEAFESVHRNPLVGENGQEYKITDSQMSDIKGHKERAYNLARNWLAKVEVRLIGDFGKHDKQITPLLREVEELLKPGKLNSKAFDEMLGRIIEKNLINPQSINLKKMKNLFWLADEFRDYKTSREIDRVAKQKMALIVNRTV